MSPKFHTNSNFTLATITFNDGKAYFQVKYGLPETSEPNFMGVPNVHVSGVESNPQVINLDNMNSIELSCQIQVGANNNAVSFGRHDHSNSKQETRQFLYSNSRQNKFWICKEEDVSVSNLLQSAGIDATKFFILSAKVKSLCLVYTQDDKWDIDERKIVAKKGLSYHGKSTIATVIDGNKKTLPLDFELHITNKKLTMELPPIMKDEYFAILRSNGLANAGPTMEINFNSDNVNWELNGITKISKMTLKQNLVLKEDFTFESEFDELMPESNIEAFNKGFRIHGTLDYNYVQNTLNLERYQVFFDGKHLVSKVQDEYTKARQAVFADATSKLSKLEKDLEVIEQKLISYNVDTSSKSKRASILSNLSKIEDSISGYEDELRKECNKICRMTMVPGYKWDSCHLAKNLGNISCLKFKKDAIISANMHCLADCEIKQAETYEKSNENGDLHEKLKKRAISETSSEDIYSELDSETKPKVDAFKSCLSDVRSNKKEMEKIQKDPGVSGFKAWIFHPSITNRNSNNFPIKNVRVGIRRYPSDNPTETEFLFDENIASTIALWRFKSFSEDKINQFLQSVKNAEFRNDEITQTICNWKSKYRIELERRSRGQTIVKTKSERYFFDRMELSDRISAVFKVEQPNTAAVIAQYAPWHTLMKHDPLDTNNYKENNAINFVKRDYQLTSADGCTSANGKLSMYEDMSLYMKSWIEAYDAGNQTLKEYQRDISKGLKRFSHDMSMKRSSHSKFSTVEKVKKMWYERLSTGFQTWSIELKRQVEELQSKGARKMVTEMNNIFTPKGENTLLSYFRSSNAINKRADDMTLLEQTDQIFGNGLKNMKTLNDGRKLLHQIDLLVNQAKRSNIRCHEEL